MTARRFEAWGTFDVANVGDLLYPLVLERELRERLGSAIDAGGALGLASPVGGVMPLGVDRPVRRIVRVDEPSFAEQADVDGIVLGGGDIMRVGAAAAADLVPGAAGLYRYDAFIGELAVLAEAIPVVWNAVGVPVPFDERAAGVVRLLAARSRYVSVRDETSRHHLQAAGVDTEIDVVPDPALVLDRVFPNARLDAALAGLRTRGAYPASGPVLAMQISFTAPWEDDAIARALRALVADRPGLQVVLVPLGPCHGDVERGERLAAAVGAAAVAIDGDITLGELVAAVAGADAFVGSSLHGNVIAARYGVPGAFLAPTSRRPHKLLEHSELLGRARVLVDDFSALPSTAAALLDGRVPVDRDRIELLAKEVDAHYDRLAAELIGVVPDAAVRAAITARVAGVSDAVGPSRLARTAADDAFGESVHALRAELHSVIDTLERVQHHADEVERARLGLESRLQQLAARGADDVRPDDPAARAGGVISFDRVRAATMQESPYRWGVVGDLYDPADRQALIDTYPVEPFATISGDDGEKSYEYEARCLVAMGGVAPWRPDLLSESWFRLATDLCSRGYRAALSELTGRSLDGLIMEANAFHYGPGSWLGPHVDLPEKILTHVLYFNDTWDAGDGGCLRVLASGDDSDVVEEVLPIAGSSVVVVRSDVSWHAVTRVDPSCRDSRRSVTVTFYPPGAVSTMWPPGNPPRLHRYPPEPD